MKYAQNIQELCSKHGKNCRVLTNGCVKTINPEIIYKKVKEIEF